MKKDLEEFTEEEVHIEENLNLTDVIVLYYIERLVLRRGMSKENEKELKELYLKLKKLKKMADELNNIENKSDYENKRLEKIENSIYEIEDILFKLGILKSGIFDVIPVAYLDLGLFVDLIVDAKITTLDENKENELQSIITKLPQQYKKIRQRVKTLIPSHSNDN